MNTLKLIKSTNKLFLLKRNHLYNFGTLKTFILPDLGEKIKEATVKEWHVKVGDNVEEFQTLADVSTDKLFTQIPSAYEGKIHKLFYGVEDTALVGDPFVQIEVEDESNENNQNQETEQKQESNQEQQEVKVIKKFILPDLGEKIKEAVVKEWHVKEGDIVEEFQTLADVATDKLFTQIPSAYDGKVHKLYYQVEDTALVGEPFIDIEVIEKQSSSEKQQKKQEPKKEPKKQPEQKEKKQQEKKQQKQPSPTFETEVIQMDNIAHGMQKSMTAANDIPHLYIMEEIDLTNTVTFRNNLKKQGHKLTFTPIFIKAFSLALKDFPVINSLYDQNKPFEYDIVHNHNITIAIDTPQGLQVPNIKNVQDLSLLQIQQELSTLKQKAYEGHLGAHELFEGTVTISNIGTIGGTYANPLLLAPQTSIVSIGRTIQELRYVGNNLETRDIINVSLGCDHRVIDGATATQFLNQWKFYLENPTSMLLRMK